ncbi:MAG TPA: RDD family protein [Terriglobales bacterium]|nr:RDD family protein [Terriglobales bacterium]
MKTRFQVDRNAAKDPPPPAILVDPEAYDASEQRFAASLEERAAKPKFVLNEPAEKAAPNSHAGGPPLDAEDRAECIEALGHAAEEGDPVSDQPPIENSDAWRRELQTKLSQYRARKQPPPPRYPSLQLKFETTESWNRSAASLQPASSDPEQEVSPVQDHASEHLHPSDYTDLAATCSPEPPEPAGRLLEFPYLPAPPLPQDELAEPVFAQPPIMEAPELLPPPPVLGGILIEPPEEKIEERRPGIDLPLKGAAMPKRVMASLIDAFVVLSAGAVFAYIFSRITASSISWRQATIAAAGIVACFWVGYQYLLLVYAGTTPGLKLSKLQLSRFDGRPVPRRLRRWRVLASMLSGFSLALGYAWCFFDEDQLCWHDRITRTYMAPNTPA